MIGQLLSWANCRHSTPQARRIERNTMMPERYGRFKATDGKVFFAAIEADGVQPLDAAPWLHGRATGEVRAAKDLKQLCPIAPTKIVCVGWNYAAHTREAGGTIPAEPMFFLKPPSALVGPGDAV